METFAAVHGQYPNANLPYMIAYQLIVKGAITLSPFLKFRTSLPTS
jgi:hypothetical protein